MEIKYLLRHVVNIQHWLDNDPDTDWQDRLVRDRKIQLSNPSQSPARSEKERFAQVIHWWQQINITEEQVNDSADNLTTIGGDVAGFFGWATILTAMLGCFLGAGAAMTVLHYDGASPINVLVVLGCLLLAPLVTLVASLLLPFVSSRSFLGSINLGAIVQAALVTRYRQINTNFDLTSAGMEGYFRWRLMFNSQVFGLAFALAALAVLLLKVTLTDLAFAWGTTLSIGNEGFFGFVQIMAAPWASVFSQAVPDQELVAASRYYRLSDSLANVSAAALTRWWMFLAMSLLVYGVLLRSILLIVAARQSRVSLNRGFLNHPQIVALSERLNAAVITSAADTVEADFISHKGEEAQSGEHFDTPACIFLWHQAPAPFKKISAPIFSVNDEQALSEQLSSLGELAKDGLTKDGLTIDELATWVVCKGWEPPLLEFHDFMQALRSALGPAPAIVVMPVDEEGAGSIEGDKLVWRESLARLKDPHLYVQ